jgi:hypothetical protein
MAAGLLLVQNAHATFDEGGTISQNTTWTGEGSHYLLTENMIIESGVTLTIQPGTTVNFGAFQMQVNGVLIAQGTSSNIIVFSGTSDSAASVDFDSTNLGSIISYADVYSVSINIQEGAPTISDNYFAGAPTSPIISVNNNGYPSSLITGNSINVVSTDGIDVESGSASITDNVIIGQDYQGVYGIYAASSSATSISNNNITNCYSAIWAVGLSTIEGNNIMHNLNDGVCSVNLNSIIENNAIADNVCGVSGAGIIENNTITDNSVGLWSPSGTIVNNNILNNYNSTGGYTQNIHLTNSNYVTAINNWWGLIDTAAIDQTIWDYKNATNLGVVQFVPFLNESNPSAPSTPTFIPVPTPPPTPAPGGSPTPVPTNTPYVTPSPSPYANYTPLPPYKIPTQPQKVTPSPIICNLSSSDMNSILVIVVAFILAASIIAVLNLKFGRKPAPKRTKRRKRKRKNAEENSNKPAAEALGD